MKPPPAKGPGGTVTRTRSAGDSPAEHRSDNAIYREVLESMTCGVMLIDNEGVVETVNACGAAILGIDRDALVGQRFADALVANEDLDELTDIVLGAIYERAVGEERIANVIVGQRPVPLGVATSYLYDAAGEAPRRARGVVAVFTDISELERLRETEHTLGKHIEAKHKEIRDTNIRLETRNRELATLARRVQTVRTAASAVVIAAIAGIGAWLWTGPETDWLAAPAPPVSEQERQLRFITVEPTRIASTLTIPSTIGALREVVVISPSEGQIGAVHVQGGQRVGAGQALLDLDLTEARIRRRKAQAAHLKAQAQMTELENWSASVDASKARRSVAKARMALEAGTNRLAETRFLVDQGLIPAIRGEAATREQHSRRLDLESAEQDLAAVLAKGRDRYAVTALELANTRAEVDTVETIIANATIVSPIAGVILNTRASPGRANQTLAPGTTLEPGQPLLTIGDIEGVTATGRVGEVDVRQIRAGHRVRIAGPAFAGTTLEGEVQHVSSQATRRAGGTLPTFEVTAVVETLDAEQRASVRLGMSAAMEIVVYENNAALVVPVSAVDLSEHTPRLRVRDATTQTERLVEVTTGVTTLDSVEIRTGLAPGDQVAVP